jgi:hypothetical protein
MCTALCLMCFTSQASCLYAHDTTYKLVAKMVLWRIQQFQPKGVWMTRRCAHLHNSTRKRTAREGERTGILATQVGARGKFNKSLTKHRHHDCYLAYQLSEYKCSCMSRPALVSASVMRSCITPVWEHQALLSHHACPWVRLGQ